MRVLSESKSGIALGPSFSSLSPALGIVSNGLRGLRAPARFQFHPYDFHCSGPNPLTRVN